MKDELKNLKKLILKLIQNENPQETLTAIIAEGERLPDVITANIFSLSDYAIQKYIGWSQETLVKQADLLYKYDLHSPAIILKKAQVVIHRILRSLDKTFPEICNSETPLPMALHQKLRLKYTPKIAVLAGRFKTQHISDHLSMIALYPLRLLENTKVPIRYSDYHYLLNHVAVLQDIGLIQPNAATSTQHLCAKLIAINYNSVSFIDYCTANTENDMAQASTAKDREMVLKRMQKWLKQINDRANSCFDQHFNRVKDFLLEWIIEEEQFMLLLNHAVKAVQALPQKAPQKVHTSIGVLSLMTRLCVRAGLYPGMSQVEVIDHMVATYSTKKTERMSWDGFKNLYTSPKTSTGIALRKVLRKVMEDLDYFIRMGSFADLGLPHS